MPADGFHWRETSIGSVLECEPLARRAAHAFSTRALEVPAGAAADHRAWEAIAAAFGVAVAGVARARQVHGTTTLVARRGGSERVADWIRADADVLVTDDPAVALTVRVADCVPVLLAHLRTSAVAAVHAGWRGTAAGAAAAAVRALDAIAGGRPGEMVAAIGPAIGPCCYQVGPEVARTFLDAGHGTASVERWFRSDVGDRSRLDLWSACRDQLTAAGVSPSAVHVSRLCTMCHQRTFHSFRAAGPRAGRLIAAIRPRETA